MGQMNIDQIKVRRVGKSLYCRVPPSFVRKYGLSQGDQIFWSTDENGARIKAVRVEKPEMQPEDEETVA
jgi:antitoxin component of MazEF toxin-antitoxin module